MTINLPNLSGASDISDVMIPNPQSTIRNRKSKIPHSSPSCLPPQSGLLPPPRRGAPKGNKNAVGHGAPSGNKNGLGHGAPRGNRNAVKFGVYTREFAQPIARPPGVSLIEALELEIHRLRLYVRDELASVSPASLDFRSSLSLLRAVTIAVGRIRRLHHHIHRLQTSHTFESDLGRSIARKLHLFPMDEQESGLSAPLFSRSPLPVRGGVNAIQDNCLLVPLFSNVPDLIKKSDMPVVGLACHLFRSDKQVSGLSAPLFSRSPLPVRGGVNAIQDNCLLVPLFTNVPDLSKKSDISDVPSCRSGFQTGQSDVSDMPAVGHACCVTDQELAKQPFGGLLELNRQILTPQFQIPHEPGS